MPILASNNQIAHFAHIPKCGGHSVEAFCSQLGIKQAFLDNAFFSNPPAQRWNNSSPQHIDGYSLSRLFPATFFDFGFAVVRHPIKRFVSAFKMQTFQERTIKPSTSISDFVKNDLLSASTTLGFCDNHFFPQISFLVPGIDYHIFKIEDGLTAVSEFIGLKFLGMVPQQTIGHLGKSAPVKTQLEENINLSNEAMDILKDVYKKDFENFSYENVDFWD